MHRQILSTRAGPAQANVKCTCGACRDEDVDPTWGACTLTTEKVGIKHVSARHADSTIWLVQFVLFSAVLPDVAAL